jgi:hypothetical protein
VALDIIENAKREKEKIKKEKIKRVFTNFLIVFILLLIPFFFLYNKFKYYIISYSILVLFYFFFFICKEFCNMKKRYLLLLFPFVGNLIFLANLTYFNYFYWLEMIFIFIILIFVYIYSTYNFYRKYFKIHFSLTFLLLIFVFLFNFIPSYLMFKKDNYYSFVYLPWNSVKIEANYIWQQPVIGVKWIDKINENGEIVKISVPYVKNYINNSVKETIWYNFFTRNYLVKVEGLDKEGKWLVINNEYQNNKSVANNKKCYFEIGEAPHKPVVYYEKQVLEFLETKDKEYFEKFYYFTENKDKSTKFKLNNWNFYKPLEVIYLFKPYFVPMGIEYKNNKDLCKIYNKEKAVINKI